MPLRSDTSEPPPHSYWTQAYTGPEGNEDRNRRHQVFPSKAAKKLELMTENRQEVLNCLKRQQENSTEDTMTCAKQRDLLFQQFKETTCCYEEYRDEKAKLPEQ